SENSAKPSYGTGWGSTPEFCHDPLVCSMSAVGHCGDNAACEGFFGLLKRERIRRQIYPTKDAARAEVFDYIEMFYNPNRRHGSTGDLSPVEFERRYAQRGS
ncbi:IS3 family transposase, partial [Pseudomonas syringae pv. actinidiae]|nr:IS3 family transposase [Pseudomonas syringae pv. actinidiae]MDU8207126.1 IS3 family transposase [Pseudomonas syringae pv. actinidiae]